MSDACFLDEHALPNTFRILLFKETGLSVLSDDDFMGGYPMYFGLNVDTDSMVYLMLSNDFLHKKYPQIITVAEVSALNIGRFSVDRSIKGKRRELNHFHQDQLLNWLHTDINGRLIPICGRAQIGPTRCGVAFDQTAPLV